MANDNFLDYSTPIYRALLSNNLFLGIGLVPAMFILLLTIVLMNVVSIWCFIVGVILIFISKWLCKNDNYALTILFDRILDPNIWRKS